jgi:hypothetical protein
MEQMNRQTETRSTKHDSNTAQRVVGIIFGIIEVFLAFRLVFKMLGANPDNGFVRGLYAVTQLLVGLFEGIFSKVTSSGLEHKAVLEPATLIAMVVIALIAWGVSKMITPRTFNRVESTQFTENDKHVK